MIFFHATHTKGAPAWMPLCYKIYEIVVYNFANSMASFRLLIGNNVG